MIFRNFRTKRAIKEFQATADPQTLAEEKAALLPEDAQSPNKSGMGQSPTPIGTEIMNQGYKGFRPIPALKPTDSSWKQREDFEPERFDQPKD